MHTKKKKSKKNKSKFGHGDKPLACSTQTTTKDITHE
jgi:hypothetical protein